MQEISVPPCAATDLALVRAPWSPASSGAAALLSGRATQHPMQPPAFAVAESQRMVSGIDDRLHRPWTLPGQTLRARVNRRAREPPKALRAIPQSCGTGNILVRIMNLGN